jgi:hypothetical protein
LFTLLWVNSFYLSNCRWSNFKQIVPNGKIKTLVFTITSKFNLVALIIKKSSPLYHQVASDQSKDYYASKTLCKHNMPSFNSIIPYVPLGLLRSYIKKESWISMNDQRYFYNEQVKLVSTYPDCNTSFERRSIPLYFIY